MEMETEPRNYQQVQRDLQAVQDAIEYVENGALTMSFNSNKHHLEEARDAFQEAQQQIDDEFQVEIEVEEDGETVAREVYRTPDGRPVVRVDGTWVYATWEDDELRPSDTEYIKDEDSDETVRTPQGEMLKAQWKTRALSIYPSDREAYQERSEELMESEKEVWVEPVNREVLEDDAKVNTELSPDLSSIMWMFKQFREARSDRVSRNGQIKDSAEEGGEKEPEPA